jgi:hypothetical protein
LVTTARRRSIWQRVAALAPLLLLVVSLPSQAWYRCRFTGVVRAACCCPVAKASRPAQAPPAVSPQDCCDRGVAKPQHPIAAAEPPVKELGSLGVPVSAVVPVLLALPGIPRVAPPRQSHGPPRGGPPLVLLKHAFLI